MLKIVLKLFWKKKTALSTFKLIGRDVYLEPCADSCIRDEDEDPGQHSGDVCVGALTWYCLATETDLCERQIES